MVEHWQCRGERLGRRRIVVEAIDGELTSYASSEG